jgi:hypothetical protein
MAFLQEVGNFFSNLGEGVTTTVQGFGANIQSQADLNQAQAAAIMAAAASTSERLAYEEAERKRKHQLMLILLAALVVVPLAGMAIYYGLKK